MFNARLLLLNFKDLSLRLDILSAVFAYTAASSFSSYWAALRMWSQLRFTLHLASCVSDSWQEQVGSFTELTFWQDVLKPDPEIKSPPSWLMDVLKRFWPIQFAIVWSSYPRRKLQVVLSSKRPVRESLLVSLLWPMQWAWHRWDRRRFFDDRYFRFFSITKICLSWYSGRLRCQWWLEWSKWPRYTYWNLVSGCEKSSERIGE